MKDSIKVLTVAELARLETLVRQKSPKRGASVTVSASLLDATDRLAGQAQRSAFVERALRRYLRYILRAQRDARELAIINANATRLNAESDSILADQAALGDE